MCLCYSAEYYALPSSGLPSISPSAGARGKSFAMPNKLARQSVCLSKSHPSGGPCAFQYKFEYLLLESAKEWEALPSLIEQTKPNRQFSAVENVGVCIRRLELLTSTWTDEKESGAIRLLKRCPNLQILLVGSFGDAMGRVSSRIASWRSFSHHPPPSCTPSVFALLSGLEVLHHFWNIFQTSKQYVRFPYDSSSSHRYEESSHPPSLKIFILSNIAFNPSDLLDTLTEWKLPALRRVSLREQQIIEDQKLFSFFLTHGTQLKILEMDCLSLLAMCVLIMCPNVTDIITDIRVAVGNQLLWHPAVQRIGFRRFYMVEDRHV